MVPSTLVRAGIVTLFAGVYLYWSVPIWLRFIVGPYWDYEAFAYALFFFCVSFIGTGGLLLFRGAFLLLPSHRESARSL